MTPAQIATLLVTACTSYIVVHAVPTGNHTCTGIIKIPVTVLVNVTVPVTFRSYTWCLRVPPRCSKYTVQLRDRVQLHTELHNKTITVCCRGFVEMENRCVPACPEGADCPFMHCNRTNHCHCTPGYTGLYCNDPCPRGVWGRDCKRPCDCPTGYTCHHLTGDCFVDDRPARKTTTTPAPTTRATAKTTTTTLPTVTTESTTLETVKTPVFRFPPPPWVDTAASTTVKKLTTRVIQDDPTSPSGMIKVDPITFLDSVDTIITPSLVIPFTTSATGEKKLETTVLKYSQPLSTDNIQSGQTSPTSRKVTVSTTPGSGFAIWPSTYHILTETTEIPTTIVPTLVTETTTTVRTTKPTTQTKDTTTTVASKQSYTVPSTTATWPVTVQNTKSTNATTVTPLQKSTSEAPAPTPTTVSPEFKVIKVIKTDQSLHKLHKVTTTKQLNSSDELPISESGNTAQGVNEQVVPRTKVTALRPFTKTKNEGSQIIYISPTNKEKHSEIITVAAQLPTKNNQRTTEISKEYTLFTKAGGSSLENEIILKASDSTDINSLPPKTTLTEIPLHPIQQTNNTIMYRNTIITERFGITDKVSIPDETVDGNLQPKLTSTDNVHETYTTRKIPDEPFEITTLIKKQTKDFPMKKVDEKMEIKVLKKVTSLAITTTLSPIHLLKQLLNATSKPKVTISTTVQPAPEVIVDEPLLKLAEDDTKESSKKKHGDIVIPHAPLEKTKKKHDKTKQNKHTKDIKDNQFQEIPTEASTLITLTTVPFKSVLTVSDSYNIPEDVVTTKHATTHFPNQIWPVMNPDVNTPDNVKSFRPYVTKRSTHGNSETVTDSNEPLGSNAIHSLHTSHDLPVKSYLSEEPRDIDDLLKKKETLYTNNNQQFFPPGTTFMLGITLITFLALAIALWIYCRDRGKKKSKTRPCVMTYELPEPTPSDIHTLEQTFFCPTFTNNYAAKLNRELNELSYDHPRSTKTEPLYAEVKY